MEISEKMIGNISLEQKNAARLFFGFVSIALCIQYILGFSLTGLNQPALKFPYVDLTYWMLHLISLPELLVSRKLISILFDSSLLLLSISLAIYPEGKIRYVLFVAIYFLYFVLMNTFGLHHAHTKVAILLLSIVFLFRADSFYWAWEGARYYLAFLMVAAFLWKVVRASLFYPDQSALIIKQNFTSLFWFHPEHWIAGFYRFLLQHPLLTQVIFTIGVMMEGAFIVAFFTKKWDKLLRTFLFLLPLGFLINADAYFFELWAGLMVFFPLASFQRKFSFQRFRFGSKALN
ncbi:hypothetical protein [Paracnuella aquatica]|uniref:hypothetical protein n=1 Tax=Paracnuella aquatica TaxID=2268757 RepID=UPI000F513126|nr:hypothetical protein [Paracnuella aquatica]RPD51458.1 hypothetical protein DRJ53_01900 [Paracnuella aquatica]